MTTVHIGCGAGFSGDRLDAALPILATLARRDGPRYLMYEVLAERTLAMAQRVRRRNPSAGYSPYLEKYLRLSLAEAKRLGVRIVTNMGAANPIGAADRVATLAREIGVEGLRIAAVTGDDLLEIYSEAEIASFDTIEGTAIDGRPIVAANAYLGARAVAEALKTDADIVLVGRTTDSALALGPLIHEFGWSDQDWDHLAAGTIAGHILECGGQATGAYFADPGFKDVPDLANVGFAMVEVEENGAFVVTKPDDTGGLVSRATVTEQILYEMHDPAHYLTPDCAADVSELTLDGVGADRVRVTGVKGHAAPSTLKATVCVDNGWLVEAEMTYAGPNALARADLAAEIVRERLYADSRNAPLRIEVVGTGAVHDGGAPSRRAQRTPPSDGEYRLRVASAAADRASADAIADEVLSLYCSGPAAGGGYRRHVFEELATASILVPRRTVEPAVRIHERVA